MGHLARNCNNRNDEERHYNRNKFYTSALARQLNNQKAMNTKNETILNQIQFYIDSAASQHMCKTKMNIHNYQEWKEPITVHCADNEAIKALGVENIKI